MSMTQTAHSVPTQRARHTVGVEPLRLHVPTAHPAATAVVERSGRHVKVCVTSVETREFPGQTLLRHHTEPTVAGAMAARAAGIARTYGATLACP